MVSQAGGDGARRPAARRPLVRLLPLHAAERADLQQRDRGDEGHLRRLARRPRARRPRPLAPVGARHLRSRRGAGDGAASSRSPSTRSRRRCDWAVRERRRARVHPARQRAVGARLRATRGRGARARARHGPARGRRLALRRGGPGDGRAGPGRPRTSLVEDGVEAGVVSLPWLRGIDGAWLAEIADEGRS